MAQWEQIGGDVNPKEHGAVLARVEGGWAEVVDIEPNGKSYAVTEGSFHADDLTWEKSKDVASFVGASKTNWEKASVTERAADHMSYHGGDGTRRTRSWSDALPAASNSIKWWKR